MFTQQPQIYAPELALGADRVLSPELHAEQRRLRILLGGQVTAHHLVLLVLEDALRKNIRNERSISQLCKRIAGTPRALSRAHDLAHHCRRLAPP